MFYRFKWTSSRVRFCSCQISVSQDRDRIPRNLQALVLAMLLNFLEQTSWSQILSCHWIDQWAFSWRCRIGFHLLSHWEWTRSSWYSHCYCRKLHYDIDAASVLLCVEVQLQQVGLCHQCRGNRWKQEVAGSVHGLRIDWISRIAVSTVRTMESLLSLRPLCSIHQP